MVVPYSDGYTLFSTDTSEITNGASKLLFQNHTKKFLWMYDRLLMVCPQLKEMSDFLKEHNYGWWLKFRGRVIVKILKPYVIFSTNPQHFSYYGDAVFGANYTKLRYYFQKIVKSLIQLHGYPDKLYFFNIERRTLINISRIFGGRCIEFTNGLVEKHLRLIEEGV